MNPSPEAAPGWRLLIEDWLTERLNAKLEVEKSPEKQAKLREDFQFDTWVSGAADRARQIQLASHTVKQLHPYAQGTTISVSAQPNRSEELIGTHSLRDVQPDAVGNAAALDVLKLLKVTRNGKTLLDALLERDAEAIAALADNADAAEGRRDKLCQVQAGPKAPQSHTHGKQLYFPIGSAEYHMLAPLYASSLVHALSARIDDNRYSERAVSSRKARRENQLHDAPTFDLPQLAQVNFGGSKPQNVSQLNSERRGRAYLLPCLPPTWVPQPISKLLGKPSIFADAGPLLSRPTFRVNLNSLRQLLHRKDWLARNISETRTQRAQLVDSLIEDMIQFALEVRQWPANWSLDPRCKLPGYQMQWLDPGSFVAATAESTEVVDMTMQVAEADAGSADRRIAMPQDELLPRIADAFAAFLNGALKSDRLPMFDAERDEWHRNCLDALWEVFDGD